VVALTAIATLTILNVVGLRRATVLQNVATWMKFAALAAFIGLGFLFGHGDWSHFSGAGFKGAFAHGFYPFMSVMGVAFIGVFWSYDGWIYASWLGGEIRDPQRNLPRSLMIGMALIAALYITMNAVYLYALPVTGIAKSDVVAQSAASVLFSPRVAFWLSAVIALSCFGALSSNIMAGARVSYAMGRDGLFFQKMAGVHPKWRTPAFALIAQGVLSAAIAISGTYVQLFTYTMFGLMISYVVTVAAVFVLRRKQPSRPRPYLCTGYPWLPLIYIVLIGGWAINALVERPRESLAGSVLMLIGVPGYLYWKRTNRKRALS
jgi:amino acid transporter